MNWKKIFIPSGEQIGVTVATTFYVVKWRSRHGEFSSDTAEEAELFAQQLKNAFKLIKHTSGDSVNLAVITH